LRIAHGTRPGFSLSSPPNEDGPRAQEARPVGELDLDVLACPCGGRLRFIALVTERDAIVPLLESLGLPTTPPVRARARSPTLFEMDPMPVYA
jgi:hypothetical protein